MARKFPFFHLPLFLIFALLVSSFFLLLRRVPGFTILNHAFDPFSASFALLTSLFFLILLILWILYSNLVSSVFAQNFEDVLAQDVLTFLPLLFFSLTPLTLLHYIGADDLQVRLGLFVVCIGLAFLYLKLIQIQLWNKTKALPWQKLGRWFSALSLKKKLVFLFIAAIILFNAGSGLMIQEGVTLGGDEPHYLLIAQSLLQDRDFDLTNNYAQRDYARSMMFEGKLQPHVVPGAQPGTSYSFHSPGIAVLLLPFYALGTLFQGAGLVFIVRFGMSLFGALFSLQVYLFARSEWRNDNLALWVWFLASLASPVFFYSIHIYPEMVVALLSLTVFRLFRFSPSLSWPRLLLSGFLLSSFIWFHALKYIPLVVPLLVYCLWAGLKKFKLRWKLVPLISIPTLAFVLYLGFQHALYGSYSLSAVSWAQPMTEESPLQFIKNLLFNIPFRYRWETLAGYFFDQRDGLFFYSPVYFFALLGAWEMLKRKRKDFFLLLFLTSPYVLTSAFLTQRTGFAPPARPLVAVIWGMIILAGYFLANNEKKIFGFLFNLAAAVSVLFVFLLLKFPQNLYQETTRGVKERGGGLFYLLSNLHFRLPDCLPSYIKVENWHWLPNFIWLGATILFVMAYAVMKKRSFSLKFSSHLLLTCVAVLIFFFWFVLYPRQVLVDPVRVTLPSGEKVTFYSLSRSSRLIEPGKFQLRQDHRAYRFLFTTPSPVQELNISLGSATGDYSYEIRIFDETFFRGQTVKEVRALNMTSPPRYKLGKASYYELTLQLGKGTGAPIELNPYLLTITPLSRADRGNGR
jgi:hypothetical protein